MSMKIEHKRLASFCNIAAALVPECRLMITKDGFNTMAVDTANVGMVSIRLPAASFGEYGIAESTEIGMDVPKWKQAIGILKEDTITLTLDPATKKITFTDGSYTLTHTPLDPNTCRKRPNPPTLNLPASLVVDAPEFAETIAALAKIGDKVLFEAKEGALELSTEGDTDKLRKGIPAEGKAGAGNSSLFSIDYLKDISKAMREAGKVTVCLGKDHPVRFDFDIEGMECAFLLAPRIDQEEKA